MSEIPEVFAIFEQKLAHVLSFNLRQKGQKKAIEELLVYFSGIVERASKAEARIAELAQAVGLITTLKPTMVMDTEHPLDMAKEVAEYVTVRIAELESELDTSRQKLTDCDAKVAERDKALNYMVHELSRMEIARDAFVAEAEKLIDKKSDEIANLKLRLELLQDEYRWIPVSERNPKKDWFYFARENVNQVIGYYNWNHKNGWCDGKRKNIKTVTHWMKVPKLAEKEREK